MQTRRAIWPAVACALLAALAWYLARDEAPHARVADAAPSGLHFFGPIPAVEDSSAARAQQRRQLLEQVRLTDHTYCSYLQNSRYPHESRPAGHNPDQLYPNRPLLEASPMRVEGGDSDPSVMLQTTQSRVYLAAGERATLSLRAVDAHGRALPLTVTRAVAQGMSYGAQRPAPRVTLDFADGGAGAWSAALTPAQTGLAGFHGTIRTEVRYHAGGRDGFVLFDVLYSPALPAVWSGQRREAREDGSLQFWLGLDVRQPGRYVVSGRVDDAEGRPFALATFNEVLGMGAQEIRLTVFGKLLHDGAPALPLVLRDVDGYLLREDADPDRLLLPRLEGRVLGSAVRSLEGMSDAEWQSEERSRYLAEYARDRSAARGRLAQFDPGVPLPPSACVPAGDGRVGVPSAAAAASDRNPLSPQTTANARPSTPPRSRSTASPRRPSGPPTVSLFPVCAFSLAPRLTPADKRPVCMPNMSTVLQPLNGKRAGEGDCGAEDTGQCRTSVK